MPRLPMSTKRKFEMELVGPPDPTTGPWTEPSLAAVLASVCVFFPKVEAHAGDAVFSAPLNSISCSIELHANAVRNRVREHGAAKVGTDEWRKRATVNKDRLEKFMVGTKVEVTPGRSEIDTKGLAAVMYFRTRKRNGSKAVIAIFVCYCFHQRTYPAWNRLSQ